MFHLAFITAISSRFLILWLNFFDLYYYSLNYTPPFQNFTSFHLFFINAILPYFLILKFLWFILVVIESHTATSEVHILSLCFQPLCVMSCFPFPWFDSHDCLTLSAMLHVDSSSCFFVLTYSLLNNMSFVVTWECIVTLFYAPNCALRCGVWSVLLFLWSCYPEGGA